MEYRILEASSAEELAAKVNSAIAEGWELQGGVAFVQELSDRPPTFGHKYSTIYANGFAFAQAMLKKSASVAQELPAEITLHDRGDGVKDHFCIERKVSAKDSGYVGPYSQFWSDTHLGGSWCSAGTVYVGREAAEAKLRELRTLCLR